nr:uncharacterized protein LOC124816028 [Hydra vulgaris]
MLDSLIDDAPPGTVGRCSKSGWVDTNLFMDFIRHFVIHGNCSTTNKCLLILDVWSTFVLYLDVPIIQIVKKEIFFRLPKVVCNQGDNGKILSKERREKWINAINRVGNYPDVLHTRICSDHFITGKPASLFSQNGPDWVPSLNMGHKKFKFEVEKPRERYLRHKNCSLYTLRELLDCYITNIKFCKVLCH